MKVLPNGWQIKPLDEICVEIVDCINKTASTVDYPTKYKMIRTTNIKKGRVDLSEAKYVTEDTFVKWTRRVQPRRNDVILTREAPLGEVGLLRTDEPVFLGQRTILYRADPRYLDQFFLYYSLLGEPIQAQIKTLGLGSTVEHIRVPQAEKLEIPYPPLFVQRKIAAILSAYDDLIENCDRRITLLEKMAEEIYREWFVRLRFPGHEQTTFHKGIPEGWNFEKLEKLGLLSRGKSKHRPRNDPSLYGGDYPFIQTGEVKEASPFFYITDHSQTYNKRGLAQSKLWNSGTLLITIAANIAETAILTYPACIPDSIIGFVPNSKKVTAEYIKYSIDCLKVLMQSISRGTTQDNFSQAKLGTFDFLVPSQRVMEEFTETTNPIFLQIKNLLSKRRNLKQTRDRLLTRLISGKLSVEDLDIQFPPSMTSAEEEP